jgi:hypothetical protein
MAWTPPPNDAAGRRARAPRPARWHLPLAALLLLSACGGGGSDPGAGGGGGGLDPADIRHWRTRDATPLMRMVSGSGPAWPFDPRLWQSSTRPLGEIPVYGIARLGAAGREGIVVGAWGISTDVRADVPSMRLAIFEQGPDGLMRVATPDYVDSDATDGVGEVVVTDLDGDGRDDLVLTQYTETPTSVSPPSPLPRGLVLMARADGRFDRHALTHEAGAADIAVATFQGRPTLFTPGGGWSAETGRWEGAPYWQWENGGLVKRLLGPVEPGRQVTAGAVAVLDLLGDGGTWMVRSNSATGPGLDAGAAMRVRAWRFDATGFAASGLDLAPQYHDGKAAYAGMRSWLDPASKTDSFRVLVQDINHDGRPDLLVQGAVWDPVLLFQSQVLQLLVNRGGGVMDDMSDAWPSDFRRDQVGVPEPRAVDLDGSGIASLVYPNGAWLSVGSAVLERRRHSTAILVNDGTGRFHAAMDPEFTALGPQVLAYARAQGLRVDDRTQPNFIPYRRPDGRLNFLAAFFAGRPGVIDPGSNQTAYVNVPLGIDLESGMRTAITITDRHGSGRIRTFAGNDTVHRSLTDPDCVIDGGLGTDTVVYPGRRGDWYLLKQGDGSVIARPVAGGGTDTLWRVETARFDDQSVDLVSLPLVTRPR